MGVKKGKRNRSDIVLAGKIPPQEFIPLAFLQRRPLTILEALVTYLKEEKQYAYYKIAALINRDERNVRDVYLHAQKKQKKALDKILDIIVPVSIFTNRRLSPFEVLVSYLREVYTLTYHEIAYLLKRDDRTIWTVYQRVRRKMKNI